MISAYSFILIYKHKLTIIWVLVFLLFAGCAESPKNNHVTIQWEARKATALLIPQSLLPQFNKDSVGQLLQVQLHNNSTPILGEYEVQDDAVVFKPLIALTRGLQYQLTWRNKLVHQIRIPEDETRQDPVVISIHPSGDSLPVNLLKMYIVFSKPMRDGQAAEHIAVIENGGDTLSSVFLNLEPELWNRERTILTIWLDPGRIKRDLQPNKTLGSPLQAGNRYEVLVKPGWLDAEGASLTSDHRRNFLAVERDNLRPDPGAWTILPPTAGTTDTLQVQLHESLDYLVLKNAIRIIDNKGNTLNGIFSTAREETVLQFIPAQSWMSGDYTLEIESRLEDLAGNNLERLFDRDILTDTINRNIKVYTKTFRIK